MGDASHVGAGKSLTGLAVGVSLGGRVLILVPSPVLVKSWLEEMKKHLTGYTVAHQEPNGRLSGDKDALFIIRTMGRMRDHPLSIRWSLLIIDECLTVQNGTALWTAEAWRQSCLADHVLMLSATFFRSRYDKLYYMLKMLRSGLPEDKNHLDLILLETMVSQQPSEGRKWSQEIRPFTPSPELLQQHQAIIDSDEKDETKYARLNQLCSSFSTIDQLRRLIDSLSGKLLIYARSKREAEEWSESLDVPLYPDISGDSVIVTVSVGTYGLNDLVKYDTILCRPPEPDRLPQMKGRLDRPGQSRDQLQLVYFYLERTIEEGPIRRLDVASQFSANYVMPLSRFYHLSLYE